MHFLISDGACGWATSDVYLYTNRLIGQHVTNIIAGYALIVDELR